jgi:alkylation response protein AidB-like acyl-CoA dehydrogenase
MKAQLLTDEQLEQLSLSRQYGIFNANMMMLLSDDDKEFVGKIQNICLEKEEEIGGTPGHNELDIYDLFPWAGSHGLINRTSEYPHRDDLEIGLKPEILRQWTMDIFNPQLSMALGASVLAINPIAHHNEGREPLVKDLEGLLDGTKIGCIGITEPLRGSDAVNMTVKAEKVDDGVIINGDKCYTTNSPKADLVVVYAVYNSICCL